MNQEEVRACDLIHEVQESIRNLIISKDDQAEGFNLTKFDAVFESIIDDASYMARYATNGYINAKPECVEKIREFMKNVTDMVNGDNLGRPRMGHSVVYGKKSHDVWARFFSSLDSEVIHIYGIRGNMKPHILVTVKYPKVFGQDNKIDKPETIHTLKITTDAFLITEETKHPKDDGFYEIIGNTKSYRWSYPADISTVIRNNSVYGISGNKEELYKPRETSSM